MRRCAVTSVWGAVSHALPQRFDLGFSIEEAIAVDPVTAAWDEFRFVIRLDKVACHRESVSRNISVGNKYVGNQEINANSPQAMLCLDVLLTPLPT